MRTAPASPPRGDATDAAASRTTTATAGPRPFRLAAPAVLTVLTVLTVLLAGTLAVLGTAAPAAAEGRRAIAQSDPRGDSELATWDIRRVTAKRVGARLQVRITMGAIRIRRSRGYAEVTFRANHGHEFTVYVSHAAGQTPDGALFGATSLRCRNSARTDTSVRTATYTLSVPLRCLVRPPMVGPVTVISFQRAFADGSIDPHATGRDEMLFGRAQTDLDVR